MKTWRESYEDLLHAHTQLLLMLESKQIEEQKRRGYDGYFRSAKERLDNIVLNSPKGE